MASAVAMTIGGAVVYVFAFTGGYFLFSNWAKAMTLKKKKRDMTSSRTVRSSADSI